MRNKLFSSILAAIIILIVLPSICISDDNSSKGTFPIFPLYYAMVSHVLKYDDGCFKQLMDNKQLDNISEFWWGYIMKECHQYMSSQIGIITRSSNSQDNMMLSMDKLKQQCAMAVIYDNWDRINKTIVKDPAKMCIKQKTKP